jgi:DNA-binding GntR family transcriptional regulator
VNLTVDDLELSASSALHALPPRDTSALVRAVRDRLRRAIVLEELSPGSRLNQVQVAAMLGVSRMPVRAAAAELMAEGLLEPIASGGFAIPVLTPRDVRDAYGVRGALEAEAVRVVAQQQPVEVMQALDAVLRRHQALGGANDTAVLLQLDREFHAAILDGTRNPYFARAMVPLWSTVERSMVGVIRTVPDMFRRAWREHHEIADAIRSGNADTAERSLRAHLTGASDLFAANAAGEPAR